jgi:hypothetical protein
VVAVVEEEAGVDGGSGDWQSAASTAAIATDRVESDEDLESGGDLECFGMKREMIRSRILFTGIKISAAVLVSNHC